MVWWLGPINIKYIVTKNQLRNPITFKSKTKIQSFFYHNCDQTTRNEVKGREEETNRGLSGSSYDRGHSDEVHSKLNCVYIQTKSTKTLIKILLLQSILLGVFRFEAIYEIKNGNSQTIEITRTTRLKSLIQSFRTRIEQPKPHTT